MTDFDLGVLNSATKYPSIQTYHQLDPKNGKLLEGTALPFGPDTKVVLTEKVDGTNGRVVVMPDGDFFIGSREELLYARGDRIENPNLGIVPVLLPLAPELRPVGTGITVYYLEVYGKGIGGNGKQYTGAGATGHRLFDIARIPESILERPREQVASWREHGGQAFCGEWMLLNEQENQGLELTPRLGVTDGKELPQSLEDTVRFLKEYAPQTEAPLDDGAGGRAEGIVLRTWDRSLIAKARFQDYARTLGLKW